MKRRNFLKKSSLLGSALGFGWLPRATFSGCSRPGKPIRPGHPEWPVGWSSYNEVKSLEADINDLLAHNVGLIRHDADTPEQARRLLKIARKNGIKYSIGFNDITEDAELVKKLGLKPYPARMIGGAYRGKAIDRHLFSFPAGKHEIIIEPPVYDSGFPYTRGSGGTGPQKDTEPIGHYYPDMGSPVKAELIVPTHLFDGKQHLRVVPVDIAEAPAGAKPEIDSVTPELPASSETANRTLYRLSFDLSGLDNAMLDEIGIAVYWEYEGTDKYWMFHHGNVSAAALSTREALRRHVRNVLQPWIEANGGTFPDEEVLAARFGDENFFITGHLGDPVVSYPLWDYSEIGVAAYKEKAGRDLEHPRTWGFPEIYGKDAYAWWLYNLHEQCAGLCEVVRKELDQLAPNLLLFRNTTRMDVFDLANDHDGTGQELLAQHFDIMHLDPYPVNARGYQEERIPRDMSYCAGLARRYDRILVPWLQAHTYGGPDGLQHVSPDDVERMCEQHREHGPDALMWLGYGRTFPNVRPDSWSQAAECLAKLRQSPPAKPEAKMAVLRPYLVWALSSAWEGKRRNPADWLLQQFLWIWAVKYGRPYNVFEVPPGIPDEEKQRLKEQLSEYQHIISIASTLSNDAWIIGEGMEDTVINTDENKKIRHRFEEEMKTRGWLG